MNRLLVVFNTCGLSNRCNVGSYLNSINSILNQDLDGVRVALSSCMNQPNDIGMLQAQLGDSIDSNLNHEILPVNVTFLTLGLATKGFPTTLPGPVIH